MSTPLKIARLNANQSDFAQHLDTLLDNYILIRLNK